MGDIRLEGNDKKARDLLQLQLPKFAVFLEQS